MLRLTSGLLVVALCAPRLAHATDVYLPPPPPPPSAQVQAQPLLPPPPPIEPVPDAVLLPPPPPLLQALAPQPLAALPPAAQPLAPRKIFFWGIGLSGGIGGGVSDFAGTAGFGVGILNLGARFLVGTRVPDTSGGGMHSGLIGVRLGGRFGLSVGDFLGNTLFGPMWMAGGGGEVAYQYVKFKPLEPGGKDPLQKGTGVALGFSVSGEYFGRTLIAANSTAGVTDAVAGGGLSEDVFVTFGPFVELSSPKYDPASGKLTQKFTRLALEYGGDSLYLVSLTWGSTF